MPGQADMFEVDHTGRKAAKLGLSHDHEVVVEIIDEARRMHNSLARYQIGVVDCEMKRLSNADRSAELTRLWNDTFTAYSNLGTLLAKYQPIDATIEGEIQSEVAAEKAKKDETEKLDTIDSEFKKFIGDGPKPEADDQDEDEEAA
ncbi:MAG: hypothetical protein IT168_33155 [Bryobacterales bacterium]|nr:hypothetical protein [Bryobacterales bacterium]